MSKFLDQQGLQVLWNLVNNKFSTIEQLKSIVCRGYYYQNEFFVDIEHKEKYVPYAYKLYIDIAEDRVYTCDGTNYSVIHEPLATADAVGVMKLYNSLGMNEDGTISQKVLTQELRKKIEMEVEDETLNLFNSQLFLN